MIILSVFLLSLSSLAFEVLLTRVFSIGQWNHLSFMVVSIALLGFAASGTFLSILDAREKGWEKRLSSSGPMIAFIFLYTITAMASFIVLNRIPLDYFRLPLEPIQILYLLIAYLILALPFFFTGLVISLAYAFLPEKTGVIYFATMAGSGCGALLPIPFLPILGEGKLIIIAALVPLLLVVIGGMKTDERLQLKKTSFHGKREGLLVSSLGILVFAVFLVFPKGSSMVEVNPSSYKALSQILQFPDTRLAETGNSIRGRIDLIRSPYIRFAPGLSLAFMGVLPEQSAAFRDGDDPVVFYNLLSRKEKPFAEFTLPFAGYLQAQAPEHALVLQGGGGLGIACALASGAGEITVVEQNPYIAGMVGDQYGLPVVNQNPRAFLAQSDKRFDVIHVENWGTSLPGSAVLTQDHFFTMEAFKDYLRHLTEKGVLIVSRKLLLPPADSVRLWGAAYESLRSLSIKNPEKHIAILRNWDAFTLIVTPQAMKDTRIIERFARDLNFDVVYIPGITIDMVNRFNVFDEPYHFIEINRLEQAYKAGQEKAFFQANLLDVVPQADSRPFPYRFLKWSRLNELYKSTGARFYTLFMSGEIIVAVVFLEALIVAILLLILPLFSLPRKDPPSLYRILYFLAIGAGFMFVELYFIKAYIILFGDPVISFTVVLSGILIFSAIGGFLSQKVKPQGLGYAFIGLILVLILIFFALDPIMHRMLGISSICRYMLSFLLLLPPGLLMGLPFALGMRYLLKSPVQRAYSWAANGCASVLTSIASAQIAISMGIPTIMTCAISAYLIAFLCVGKR